MKLLRYGSAGNERPGLLDADGVDPVSLIGFDKVLLTKPALKKLEGMLV